MQMTPLELSIQIVEGINVVVTVVFFILFFIRICRIRKMAITCRYIDNHWKIRFAIASFYILFSAVIIVILIIYELDKSVLIQSIITSGSIGFFINSFILIMHICVLSAQIKRQIPFTRLHQNFIIYIILISLARLGLAIFAYSQGKDAQLLQSLILSFSTVLVFVSMLMLYFWHKNKKVLPKFDDFRGVDINTITQRIIPIGNQRQNHSSINQIQGSLNQKCNLIIPNVTVQLGKVRIILQMYSDDDILKSLAQQQTKCDKLQKTNMKKARSANNNNNSNNKQKPKQHLQIISDHIYTFKQIKQIYLICGRFDLETTIRFDRTVADFYRQVKKFMEELFSIKHSYTPQILSLFHIQKCSIIQINNKLSKLSISQKQLLVSHYVDYNALFLSVQIFKQFWIDDHFIFYIQAVELEQKEVAVCYRRYSDFQEFHKRLQHILHQQCKNNNYKLPPLPKKHAILWSNIDSEMVSERRKQLQNYCQQTFNEYILMTKIPRARQLIFEFLHFTRTFQITPDIRKAKQFYNGFQIKKGSIYKALVQNQYVTFYEFELFQNGISVRNIFKRFRQFISLHSSIERWMENTQIYYKLIVLPEKHLYKSQTKRHEKLITYLQNIITMKEVYKIYSVNKFFNVGQHHNSDNSGFGMSIIKRQPSDASDQSYRQTGQYYNKMGDISQISQKQRMSLLIQELGQNQS